jgi:hypothetical protein
LTGSVTQLVPVFAINSLASSTQAGAVRREPDLA